MFIHHSENDFDKLDPETAHNEGLGTRIYRPQPGASCQFPEMLSVLGEAIYRGDVPFLLNVNHKGVQFVTPFSKFTMTITMISEGSFGGFQYIHAPPYWLLDPYGYNQ